MFDQWSPKIDTYLWLLLKAYKDTEEGVDNLRRNAMIQFPVANQQTSCVNAQMHRR